MVTIENIGGPILITGGTGFIGRHLAENLSNLGYEVHVLARKLSDAPDFKNSKIFYHKCDLTDFIDLKNTIKLIKPAGIFHLATSTIMSGVTAPAEEVIRINFNGTVNLVQAIEDFDYKFFITTGSFLEYGLKDKPAAENDLCNPLEIYSITKLASTLYLQAQAKTHRRPMLIFRLFTPFGPHIQKGRLIYEVIHKMMAGEPIKLTSPKVTRDFIFVQDCVDLLLEGVQKASDLKGEIFNAGFGQAVNLETLVDRTSYILGVRPHIIWGGSDKVVYDSDLWQADMTKTFTHFRWRPKDNLAVGLKKTIEWFTKKSNKNNL